MMASVMIPMIRYIQKTLKVITEDQNGWHVQTREAGQDPGAGRPRHRPGAEPGDRRPARSQERPGAEPGDRNPEAVRRFIERFATVLGEAGFPQTPARVFVALMTSDDGLLTAAELGGILRASPATVSGGVRYLIQVGLVSRESEPGSRATCGMPSCAPETRCSRAGRTSCGREPPSSGPALLPPTGWRSRSPTSSSWTRNCRSCSPAG